MPPAPVIDLHLHTTASDGLYDPDTLVTLAWRAGIRTMSVTDHDTTAGLAQASLTAQAMGMVFVPGIEITAVHEGRDTHILGYFIREDDEDLASFLERQRYDRVRRVTEMAERLATLGKPIELEASLRRRTGGQSIGRPMVAKALVRAGHVTDIREAFDELIGQGRPAFIARSGPEPAEVIAMIARAGGLSSLAHPGLLKRDDLIASWVDAGLSAIEAFHSEHTPADTARYLDLAGRHGALVTGGSDYHGEPTRRRAAFGSLGLPEDHFERLLAGRRT